VCALYELEGVAELCGSHAHRPPKYLSEMARTSVADFERDFDEAVGGFSDQLLRLQHALSDHELKRRIVAGLSSPHMLATSLKSLHLLDVARFPTLVERCFGRVVEPEYGKIPLTRHGREPVASLAASISKNAARAKFRL
jgi:hypothetical protein